MKCQSVGFVNEQFNGIGENVLRSHCGLEALNDRFRDRTRLFFFREVGH